MVRLSSVVLKAIAAQFLMKEFERSENPVEDTKDPVGIEDAEKQ